MKPNLIFILIDDLGWKDVGCMGSAYYQTPHIDALAADGMLFEQAYAAAPVCSPSRGAIYSGRYPAANKLTTVFAANVAPDDRLYEASKPATGNMQTLEALHRHCLSPKFPTIGDAMRTAGYRTGFVGKWHCGWAPSQWPDQRGFEFAEGFRTEPTSTRGHWAEHYLGTCKGLPDLKGGDYMTDALTARAIDFITDNADRPFFLVLSHYAVHQPLQAPADLVAKYEALPKTDQRNAVYAAMVEKVDQSVGQIVAVLEKLGLTDNTAVFFTSDNGGLSPKSTSNYPLMGGKSFSYEAGMRVPLIVKWPGHVAPGSRSATRTVAVDFFPTWLEMAGAARPPELSLDGVDLLPELTGAGALPDRPIFFHYPHYTHATGPFSSVIADDRKLIRFYNDTSGAHHLFDLAADPYEQTDLADTEPDKVAALRKTLDAWLARTGAELPRPNPGFDPAAPPAKDRRFTWQLALSERAEHERNLNPTRQARS